MAPIYKGKWRGFRKVEPGKHDFRIRRELALKQREEEAEIETEPKLDEVADTALHMSFSNKMILRAKIVTWIYVGRR
jgi:hypothetical protein